MFRSLFKITLFNYSLYTPHNTNCTLRRGTLGRCRGLFQRKYRGVRKNWCQDITAVIQVRLKPVHPEHDTAELDGAAVWCTKCSRTAQPEHTKQSAYKLGACAILFSDALWFENWFSDVWATLHYMWKTTPRCVYGPNAASYTRTISETFNAKMFCSYLSENMSSIRYK